MPSVAASEICLYDYNHSFMALVHTSTIKELSVKIGKVKH